MRRKTGEGGGGAKKGMKPEKSYRRDLGNGGVLGGRKTIRKTRECCFSRCRPRISR